jgi:hypothetical protein
MIEQLTVVDENGDIILHGRQGAEIILDFENEDGSPLDMSAATVTFEVGPTVNINLTPVAGQPSQMRLTLTNDDVKAIALAENKEFVVLETSSALPTPHWTGLVYIIGWTE